MPRFWALKTDSRDPASQPCTCWCWWYQRQDLLVSTAVPGTTTKANTQEMLDQDYNTQCGLMSALLDLLIQRSKMVGAGSTSTLAMEKHFQGCWLLVRCQATTGFSLLLCTKPPDVWAQNVTCASLLSRAYKHPESSWKETHNALCVAFHNTTRLLSSGNEVADHLAKYNNEQEQPNLKISYEEAKALVKQHFSQKWIQTYSLPSYD